MAKLYSIITSHLLLQTAFVGVNAAFLLSNTNNCSPIRLNTNHHSTVVLPTRQLVITASSSSDDTNHAEAFTNYMAKSHEDKLRAVKAVEDTKNAEIEDLKRQIEEKKSGTTTSSNIITTNGGSPPPPIDGSMEIISAKLTAYQTFMSQYIVRAQDEKFNAIRAAEATISRKYEDKLSAFMLAGADASSITIASQSSASVVTKEVKEPVVVPKPVPAAVGADATVPGEVVKEEKKIPVVPKPAPAVEAKAPVDTVKEVNDKTKDPVTAKSAPPTPAKTVAKGKPAEKPPAAPTATDTDESVPPEVIAADHGLRADGGVGGLTLAERVSQGADSSAGSPVTTTGTPDDANGSAIIDPSCLTSAGTIIDPRHRVYFERNTVVSTAAGAGAHNRWGVLEEKLATEYVADTIALAAAAGGAPTAVVPSKTNGVVVENQELKPEVEEADHGLRADGGVGGPSLAQRVNLGAQLLNKT